MNGRVTAYVIPDPGEPSVLCVCPDNSELGWMKLSVCTSVRRTSCGGGGGDTGNTTGQGTGIISNRVNLTGPDTGNAFLTSNNANSFSDWDQYRRELACARARMRGDTEASGDCINNLDGGVSTVPELDFVNSNFKVEDFPSADRIEGSSFADYLASGNNDVCLGGLSGAHNSIPPSFGLFYNSLYGGQAETTALKLEQFPDGRVVFTDFGNTRWTFRPYGKINIERGDNYFRSPLGATYRLVYGDISHNERGYRVESPDGDIIEFASVPAYNIWRPSRYNAADGSWLTYNYGPNGLSRITDMHGGYFAFERDAKGLPLTITDQNGKRTIFTYDASGRATAVIYPDGFQKHFSYDSAGFLSSVKNGAIAEERYTYDSTGRVLTSESEGGVNRLEHYYADVASKAVVTDALGNKTEYSYVNKDGQKLTTAIKDAAGGISRLGYDVNYNVDIATDALGRVVSYMNNANGDPIAITDPLGNTSTIEYQPKERYTAGSGTKSDFYSRPISITDPVGRTTHLDYDRYGNLAEVIDVLGNKTKMDYDNAGHMLSLRDAMGSTYKYEYIMGLAKSIDPLGRVTKYQRDADSRVTMLTDPLGRSTSFTYDLSGNVTEVRNPADFVTRFAYSDGACPSCGGSQLSAITDPKGNTWAFGYDQYGRLTNTINPLGQQKAYNYDKMSRVTEVKDSAGNITAFTYDALNRLTKKDVQTPAGIHAVTNYIYDAVGNLLSASNSDSTVEYAYDALNRPVETKQTFAGKTYPISYTYDVVGNRTSMGTPWGKYSYTYDALNRVSSITNPQGIQINFKYNAVGRRIQKTIFAATLNSMPVAETSYSYDVAGQLLNITNKAGGKVVAFDNYTYDELGNRVRIEDQNGVKVYGYDKANRLITVKPVPFSLADAEAFVYDKNGNRRFDREAKDYKYDAANRVFENTVYTYSHDQNGNLTGRTLKASGSTQNYSYNPEGQLSEVRGANSIKVGYKYDPLGRRIEKYADIPQTLYVYDNEDAIAILDGNANLLKTFTYGPGIDEPIIITSSDIVNHYYHADGVGSITVLSDDKGTISETYTYKAYGQLTVKDSIGLVIEKSNIGNPYSFTARELDQESGLYYYRARYNDSLSGAFTQQDPIGFAGGDTNLYAYVRNNPLIFIDPKGLDVVLYLELVHPVVRVDNWTNEKGEPKYLYIQFGPVAFKNNVKNWLKAIVPPLEVPGRVSISPDRDFPAPMMMPVIKIKTSRCRDKRIIEKAKQIQEQAENGEYTYNLGSENIMAIDNNSHNCWTFLADLFAN